MLMQSFCDQVIDRAKQTVPKEFLEWDTVMQFSNYAILSLYPSAMKSAKWFYQKSQTFTATANTVTKPTDCQQILSVTIPGTVQGHATPADVRQFDGVQGSSIQMGTPSNPKYREDKLSIQLFPHADGSAVNYSGTFHYLRNFGMIASETFEISKPNVNALPVLPWWYEEDGIMEALRMLRMRARRLLDNPMSVETLLASHDDMMAKLAAGEDPLAIYRESLPSGLK